MRKLLPVVATFCAVTLMAAPAGAGDRDDQRIADAALPDLADLPEGWESEPSDDLGEETGIDECRRLDRVNQDALEHAYAETPLFSDPADPEGRTTIEGAVFVFPKVKGAKRYFAGYEADSARDCLQAIGKSQVEHLPTNEVGTADLDVSGGDDAVGYRLDIEGTDESGVTDALVLDFVVVRLGRAVVNLGAQSGEEPPSLDDVIDAMLERLEQEL
ncbi:MAG: hypothetical protein ACRDY4_08945 [Acidimicrobiia bacterium]